jgi:cellulose synthase/poly-beta-1,6-N-acetylglucosamine synthase-like glycosyltransferase
MTDRCDVLIAIPCAVQARWSSFWACVSELALPPRVLVRTGRGCSPATNRNGLIEEAFALGAEWIWFLDDDLTFRPDSLTRLLARFADPSVECVVPLSFRRQPPFRALWFDRTVPAIEAMKDTLPAPGPLVPLTAATFGGLLIRTSALKRIERPYVALGQFVPDQWDDDLYFCRKLNAAGVQIWGDSSVVFGHTTDVEVWPHYSPDMGWSVVFARGTVPFLMQPWGDPSPEPAGVS